MARRGRKRQLDAESLYWQLILSGLGTVAACKEVGIGRKTGYRWRAEDVGRILPVGVRTRDIGSVVEQLFGERGGAGAQVLRERGPVLGDREPGRAGETPKLPVAQVAA